VGILLALGSSLLWGSADFCGGLLSRRRPALAVTCASQLIALLAALLYATATRDWLAPGGYAFWAAVVAGVSGSVGLIAFYRALSVGPMGLVAAIAATAVLLPVFAGMLHGEQPGALQATGIVLAVGGVVLAGGPEIRSGQQVRRSAIGLAVLAALGFGACLWALAATRGQHLAMVLATQRATNVLVDVALMIGVGGAARFAGRDLPMLTFIGLGDLAANATYALATRTSLVSVVAVLASLYPLVTALLGRFVLGERLRPVQRVGAATALAGVLLLAT
jgi:drug/metabolite transporter (DMT)-like permease